MNILFHASPLTRTRRLPTLILIPWQQPPPSVSQAPTQQRETSSEPCLDTPAKRVHDTLSKIIHLSKVQGTRQPCKAGKTGNTTAPKNNHQPRPAIAPVVPAPLYRNTVSLTITTRQTLRHPYQRPVPLLLVYKPPFLHPTHHSRSRPRILACSPVFRKS